MGTWKSGNLQRHAPGNHRYSSFPKIHFMPHGSFFAKNDAKFESIQEGIISNLDQDQDFNQNSFLNDDKDNNFEEDDDD